MARNPRGRPRRFAKYEELRDSVADRMAKRPKYRDGIGLSRGERGITAYIKIHFPHGGRRNGKSYRPGQSTEIAKGLLSSWSWEQLEAERDRLQGRADRDEPLEDTVAPTFGDWADDWLRRAQLRTKSGATDEINVRCHILPHFESQQLPSIGPAEINNWIADKLETQEPGTVQREFNTLRAILSDAVNAGHLEQNPCSRSDPIRGVASRERWLTSEELVRLLAEAEKIEDWLPDFVAWCAHSGMRKGETLALTWDHVKKIGDRRIVEIEKSKSDQPRRVECTTAMMEILERQNGRKLPSSNAVFPVSKMTLRRRWEKARKNAELEDVVINDLRRTHATLAVTAGVDLKTVSDRLGHADLTMLQNHYAAFHDGAQAQAARTIQAKFAEMMEQGGNAEDGPAARAVGYDDGGGDDEA